MNLASAFDSAAARTPQKTAVFWGESEYSYDRLAVESRDLACRLQQQFKLEPGARVGLWMKNRPEFISALFGILMAGGVAVPINNFLKPAEVAFIVLDAGLSILITEEAMEEALAALHASSPLLIVLKVEEWSVARTAAKFGLRPSTRTEDDLAVLVYTSGTTGRPKGAMLTHGNLLHNVNSCRQVLEAVDFDRFVLLLPMFHSFMLCVCILLPLIVGGSIVLVKSLHPPKNILSEIILRQGTILPAIPQFFRTLASGPAPENLPLRLCISGAAPLPREVSAEFSRNFPTPLIEGYGLSEASPVVTFTPIHGPWKVGSVGLPIPGVEVSIQSDLGRVLPNGQVGELCVRGGNVMQGYWNKPEETALTFRDRWLLTGDLGYRDEDGYFYITDRKKDMLLVNGINVYPREIEEIILQCPGVKDVAVVGQPHPRRGEQPVAFVVVKEDVPVGRQAILKFVRDRLADYKVPRRVLFLAGLPRNATGKVLKSELRDIASRAGIG